MADTSADGDTEASDSIVRFFVDLLACLRPCVGLPAKALSQVNPPLTPPEDDKATAD